MSYRAFKTITIGRFICGLVLGISVSARAEVTRGFEPTIGIGASTLGLSLASKTDQISFQATNTSFSFVALGIDRLTVSAKIPQKMGDEQKLAYGETRVIDYQLNFAISKQLSLEAIYQDYTGYYWEKDNQIFKLPDLHSDRQAIHLFYYTDPEYSGAMVNQSNWKQKGDAGSFIYGAGIQQFSLSGEIIPSGYDAGLRTGLSQASNRAFTLSAGYGYNWLWSHWYAGAAGLLGANFNSVEYSYGRSGSTENNFGLNYGAALAIGYKWTTAKMGFYTRVYSWGLEFDDKKLSNSTTNAALYYSYPF